MVELLNLGLTQPKVARAGGGIPWVKDGNVFFGYLPGTVAGRQSLYGRKGTGRQGPGSPARRQCVMDLYDAGLYFQPLQLHKTEDFQESARTFVEKRKPEYGVR